MADQNIKIKVGTSYNGEGLTRATNAVAGFSGTVSKGMGSLKNMTGAIGELGNSAGQLTGTFGKVAGGLSSFLSTLSMGPGAIGSFIVACGMLGVSIGKSVFGPIREANREFHDLLKKQGDIGRATHELYDKWRKKWADADKKAQEERKKAEEKRKAENDALADSLYDRWKIEQQILKTERELSQIENLDAWDEAIAKEKDPLQKKLIEAQKAQAQTEIGGKNKLADAEYEIENTKRDWNIWRVQAKTDAEAKIKMENAEKKIELSEQKYAIALEQVTQANKRASEAVAQVEEEIRQRAIEDAKFNREQEKAWKEEGELINKRVETQKKIADIDLRIVQAKKRVEQSQQVREQTQRGMAQDNARHQGISGNGYQYSTDENGNINRFDQFRRAQRYARNAEHGNNGGDGDNTFNNNAMRAMRLQGRLNDGKKISKQDKQWLKDWEDFNNQDKTAQDQLNELKEIKNKLVEALGVK